jgi:hypothetical protein
MAEYKMKVGILESRDETFINDVISRLSGVEVEFLSFRHQAAPLSTDHRVIVDRASFCHPFLKETMKNLALSGTYVINNPFSATATNKLIDIGIGSTLGISFPKTFVLPGANLTEETEEWIKEPIWEQIIDEVGLPCILKPFDGYAWENVYTTNSLEELKQTYYSMSPGRVMLVQKLIRYTEYYRSFCFNKKDVLFIKWIPKPFSMGEYLYSDLKPIENMKDTLTKLTIDLNVCLDLDVNAVEWCLDESGHPWVIDAFNEVPEIKKEALPEEYYNSMVQKFVDCIEDKLDSNQRNKTVFLLQQELSDKVFRIYPPPQLEV